MSGGSAQRASVIELRPGIAAYHRISQPGEMSLADAYRKGFYAGLEQAELEQAQLEVSR